ELINAVNETLERGGSVFIPCFAVQRTQELLNDFKLAKQSGALGSDVPVWLDSPMAQRVTQIYHEALDHAEDSLFDFEELHWVSNFRQSQKISRRPGQIIMAGSGMADGGRILEHLVTNLGNSKNTVIFVGYQAEGTIGRQLVDGVKEIVVEDKLVQVRAKIVHLTGFSAHGDTNDYIAWVKRYNSPRLKKIMLVHAEPESAEALKQRFEQEGIDHPHIPQRFEEISL
ncbi:MAG: MBL fold metallo-hydrolase, partial [Candidatus Doudnabacteria bacterium]|nr:MBL fold metallo-hydrolase [Candidatus Doudnabacteria bacterium]